MPSAKPEKSSVYSIKHRETGHEYIGITSRKPEQRWSAHRCYARKGSPMVIARALRKYGPEAFEWTVLETHCDLIAAQQAEVRLISERKPHYNSTAGGEGATNPTKEVHQKMRNSALGRVRSKETRQRMSDAKKLLWQTPGHRELIRQRKQMRRVHIAVRNMELSFGTT